MKVKQESICWPNECQLAILAELANDKSYVQIAKVVGYSTRTVRRNVSELEGLTGTASTAALVAIAFRLEWLA